MLGVRAVGSAQGKFQPLGPGVCRERGLSSKNLTRQGLRGTGYGARPQILVFSPHFGGRRWAVPAGTLMEISCPPGWIFGCQREIWEWVRKDTASTEMCARGARTEPPPTFGCSRSPESSQGGLQPPTPSPWGSFPRCSSAGLIHNFQHPGGQLFATSLGRSRLGRREMSQRAIKD